jgi:hypothetical protein
MFVILHLGAFCMENAPTLVAISPCLVATGLTVVTICSRRIATRSLVAFGSYRVSMESDACVVITSVELQN